MAKKAKIRVYAREWRDHKKMTLEATAERAEMSVSYLHDLETGHPKKRWNVEHLEGLAHAFGIDPEDLLWNPLVGGPPLWRILKGIDPKDQAQAARILETFTKKAS